MASYELTQEDREIILDSLLKKYAGAHRVIYGAGRTVGETRAAFIAVADVKDEIRALFRTRSEGAEPEAEEGLVALADRLACCDDCGLPYSDPGFADLVVPHDVWNEHLSPHKDEGGLLCPTCMVRAATRAGITTDAVFTSGPFVARTAEETEDALARLDAELSRVANREDRIEVDAEDSAAQEKGYELGRVVYCALEQEGADLDDTYEFTFDLLRDIARHIGVSVKSVEGLRDIVTNNPDTPAHVIALVEGIATLLAGARMSGCWDYKEEA